MVNNKKRSYRRKHRLRMLLAKRDGLVCHWCHKHLLLSRRAPEAIRATIDHHPVPRAHGGGRTPDNTVLACHACNSSHAGRTPPKPNGRKYL